MFFFYIEREKDTKRDSGSRVVMVSTLDSPCNDPGSIPGPGGAAWIWVYYPCGSAASFGWDVKPRSSLCSTPNMDYKDPDITEEENL